MNLIDGLVLFILALWGGLAARAVYNRKKNKKCIGCSGNCKTCGR